MMGRLRLKWLKLFKMVYGADREEWASVIKERKALRGPYSQEVSKSVSNKVSK
jgi:uncharacterized protein YwgA